MTAPTSALRLQFTFLLASWSENWPEILFRDLAVLDVPDPLFFLLNNHKKIYMLKARAFDKHLVFNIILTIIVLLRSTKKHKENLYPSGEVI